MSKTIEIVSRHIGPVALCTRRGEQRTVNFEDKGGRGFARCDEDEAEILLGGIGLPDFWKPGHGESFDEAQMPTPSGNARGHEAGSDEVGKNSSLTKENYDDVKNLTVLQGLLKATEDAGLIMELIAIESQKEPSRSSWMKALNERLEELKK